MHTCPAHSQLTPPGPTDGLVFDRVVGEPEAADGKPIATFNVTGVAAAYARLQADTSRDGCGVIYSLSSSRPAPR